MKLESLRYYYLVLLLYIFQTLVWLFYGSYVVESAALVCVLLFFVIFRSGSSDGEGFTSIFSNRVFWVVFVIQSVIVCYFAFLEYFRSQYNIYDTGAFAQSISYFVTKGEYYNHTFQCPAICDHFTVSLLIFAPLFKLFNSAWWLIGTKIVFWACTSFSLKRLAKLYGLSNEVANMVAVMWLLSVPYLSVLIFEFQPSNLACLIIVESLVLWKKRKYVLYAILMLWAVFLKENMPILLVCNGLIITLIENKQRIGILQILLGALLGIFILFKFAYLLEGCVNRNSGSFGPFNLLGDKLLMIIVIMSSVSFIYIFDFRLLIIGISAFGLSLMSKSENHLSIYSHYHDIPTTYTIVCCLLALSRYNNNKALVFFRKSPLVLKLFLWLLISIFIYVNSSNHMIKKIVSQPKPSDRDVARIRAIHKFNKEVDKECELTVQDCLGIYFLEYPYMTSFNHFGRYKEASKPCNYAILDPDLDRWPIQDIYPLLIDILNNSAMNGEFEKIYRYAPLVVFKKRIEPLDYSKDSIKVEVEDLILINGCKVIKDSQYSGGEYVDVASFDKSIHAFYGPYMSLPKGKYRLRFNCRKGEKAGSGIGFFDIVAGFGAKTAFARELQDFGDIEFTLDEDSHNIEFRFTSHSSSNIIFDNFTIKKIN